MSYLIFTKNGPEKPYKLAQNQISIGRAVECEISINSNKLSRKHCSIFFKDGNYFIEDNDSSNGTFVNSKKVVSPTKLNVGDIIRIGNTQAQFSLTSDILKSTESLNIKLDDEPHFKLEFSPDDALVPGVLSLRPGEITLGRKNFNDIVINYKSVSSKHCKIKVSDTKVIIEDLGSTNGTRINGRKITQPTEIKSGNIIQIEKLKYKFHWKKFEDLSAPKKDVALEFEDEDDKTPVEELKLTSSESPDFEIKLEEPDDIGFEFTLDDVRPETQKSITEEVFSKEGHSIEIDDSQSASIELEIKQEVEEFIKDVKKGKSLKYKLFIGFEVLLILALIAVAAYIIISNSTKQVESDIVREIIEPPGDSLITKNWSFEEVLGEDTLGLKNWIPAGPDSDNPYRFIDANLETGQACLLIDRISQIMHPAECYYEEPIKVTGSQKYFVGAKIKMLEGRGAGGIKVYFYKDENAQQFLSSVLAGDLVNTVSQDWIDYKAVVSAPESAKSAMISLIVFGGMCKFLFDDVVFKPLQEKETQKQTSISITQDELNVTFKLDGTFQIYEQQFGIKTLLFDQAQWVLVDSTTKDIVSIADFSGSLDISEFMNNNKPGIKVEGILFNPSADSPGEQIPYEIIISFDDKNHLVLKFNFGVMNPFKFGLTALIPNIDKTGHWARFRKEFSDIRIIYHQRLPISDSMNLPYVFDVLTAPLINKHIKIETPKSAGIKADYYEDGVQILLQQEGDSATFIYNTHLETKEQETLSDLAEVAELRGDVALAIAHNYNLLLQTMYSPAEITRIHRRIIRLSAKIFEHQEEFSRILRNVENNPSALLFNQAINIGQELRNILNIEEFQQINPHYTQKYVLPSEEQFYLNEIRTNLRRLKSIPEQIKSFEEQYRGKIDYAYLLRAEAFMRVPLARALDYLNSESDFLAISFFLQIVQKYPLSRPATLARTKLLELANKYVKLADNIADTQPELCNQYRALIVKICNNNLANEFITASGITEKIWETEKHTWEKRSLEVINSFYTEVGKPKEEQWQLEWKIRNDATQESLVDLWGEPWWWLWNISFWEQKEKTARVESKKLLDLIAPKIKDLPEPTELPEG